MEPLIFALNAVLPIILLTLLGYFLRRIGIIDKQLANGVNKLCFNVFLPIMLFMNIYETDSLSNINWGVSLFSAAGLVGAFMLGLVLVLLLDVDYRQKGVILQCVFRSNFSILGIPLALSLFGMAGAQEAAILSLTAVPLNNILSVIALRIFDKGNAPSLRKITRDIISNKLILGVLCGLAALCIRAVFERFGIAFRLSHIKFLYSALISASGVTSTLALVALGALFTFSSVRGMWKQVVLASVMRTVVVPGIALTIVYLFFPPFYGAPFATQIALFATPVAVSSAVMASEMGGDGELAGQLVVWTTLLSALTIFVFVTLFRALGAL